VPRHIRFDPGRVTATANVAERLVQGREMGYTPPLLNGSEILLTSHAKAALRGPVVSSRPVPGGFECWVQSIPMNVGSYSTEMIGNGPWSTRTPKSNVSHRFGPIISATPPGRDPCANQPGIANLSAVGAFGDAEVVASTRAHEHHHAWDHERWFFTILGPWEHALARVQTEGRRFSGPTVADAEASLFEAVGGTPAQVAARLREAWIRTAHAFHDTPAGQPVTTLMAAVTGACDNVLVIVLPRLL
jgi:hypothetical protein